MRITHLSILNFKNIRETELTFSPGLNCFVGKNGEGKTNLLDAIHYIGFCKSHTNPIDSQNIHHDADFFMIQASCQEDEQISEVYCGVKRRQKKLFKLNGKEYDRLSEHIGKIPLVLISPSDEELIREGSDERRRFMDMVISQYDHAYMEALVAYNKALAQRNVLLKEDIVYDESLFEVYEIKMELEGAIIYQKRQAFIKEFLPVFEQYYHDISGGRERICLSYTSHISDGSLAGQLKQVRQRDILLGYTTKGIHKDELRMELDGYPIKRVGSQGQNKSFLIAMSLQEDLAITFVIPKPHGDEDQRFLKIIGACNTPVVYKDIPESVLQERFGNYMDPQEYYALRDNIYADFRYLYTNDLGCIEFSGRYPDNLLEEINNYSICAGVIARREQFDVIHSHDWLTYPAGIHAKNISGKPLVIHVHATDFDRSRGQVNPQVYSIEKNGMDHADKIICVSNLTRDTVISKYNQDPSKVITVHNAVEPVSDSVAAIQPMNHTQDKVVTFLGRITMQKGPEYFVEAAYKVLQKTRHVRFVMIIN